MADERGAVWTARIRDAKQVLNELRCASAVPNPSPHPPTRASCSLTPHPTPASRPPASHDSAGPGPAASIQDEKERIRITALQRRKLQRFEDIVDDLEDLVTDGGPTSRELEDRQGTVDAFREDIRRLNASFAGGAPSVLVEEEPVGVMGQLEQIADIARSKAAMVTGEVNATLGAASAAAAETFKKHEEAAAIRGLSSEELLALQKTQMQKQDESLESLDGIVGKLRVTSGMIKEEVDLQARMVEDLDADFTHTQNRLKKLRKQGFKLSGEKNAAEKEKAEKAEAMAEMQKNLPSYQREQAAKAEGDNCVVM